MNTDGWIVKLKKKRQQKHEMKLKQKFSFLLDIIYENERKNNDKLQELIDNVKKSKVEIIQELSTINESIQSMDGDIKRVQHEVNDSKKNAQDNIEELHNQLIENIGVVKEIIYSAIAKIDRIDKNDLEGRKQLEGILHTKSELITSGIEDVKSLVQLLAVNELMDEIDIPTTKI